MRMSGLPRALLLASILSSALILSGCESFDPQSLFEWIPDSKKKLPGERKDVFPQGTPGVPQGVPPELVKGYQAPPDTPPPVVEEKPKPKPKPKPQTARQQPAQQQQQQDAPWPAQQPAQTQSAPWPAPPPPSGTAR